MGASLKKINYPIKNSFFSKKSGFSVIKRLFLSLGISGLIFFLVLNFVPKDALAWTEPSVSPPGGNVAAPLNTSGTGQTKGGDGIPSGGFPYALNLTSNTYPLVLTDPNVSAGNKRWGFVFDGQGNIALNRAADDLGGANQDQIKFYRSGETEFRGNVGIGTTGPTQRLQFGAASWIGIPSNPNPNYANVPTEYQRGGGGIIMASRNIDGSWAYGSRLVTVDYGNGLGTSFDVLNSGTWTNNVLSISGRSGEIGNVGIGTIPNIGARLEVAGGNEPFVARNNDYYFFAGANRGGGDYVDIGAFHKTDGWKNLVINRDNMSNVGIGTTNPQATLDVAGTVWLGVKNLLTNGGMEGNYQNGVAPGWIPNVDNITFKDSGDKKNGSKAQEMIRPTNPPNPQNPENMTSFHQNLSSALLPNTDYILSFWAKGNGGALHIKINAGGSSGNEPHALDTTETPPTGSYKKYVYSFRTGINDYSFLHFGVYYGTTIDLLVDDVSIIKADQSLNEPTLTVTTDGQVGIGTANPQTPLHVRATGNFPLLLETSQTVAGSVVGAGFSFKGGEDTAEIRAILKPIAGASFATDLELRVHEGSPTGSWNTGVYIKSNGTVGIGRTNPEAKLDIAGPSLILRGNVAGEPWINLYTDPNPNVSGTRHVGAINVQTTEKSPGVPGTEPMGFDIKISGKVNLRVLEDGQVANGQVGIGIGARDGFPGDSVINPVAKLTVTTPEGVNADPNNRKVGSLGDAIYAYANSTNAAISAEQTNANGWAGYFSGDVNITNPTLTSELCLNGVCKTAWPIGGGASYWTLSGSRLYPSQTSYDVIIGETGISAPFYFDVGNKTLRLGGPLQFAQGPDQVKLSITGESELYLASRPGKCNRNDVCEPPLENPQTCPNDCLKIQPGPDNFEIPFNNLADPVQAASFIPEAQAASGDPDKIIIESGNIKINNSANHFIRLMNTDSGGSAHADFDFSNRGYGVRLSAGTAADIQSWGNQPLFIQNIGQNTYINASGNGKVTIGTETPDSVAKLTVNGGVKAGVFYDDTTGYYADLNTGGNLGGNWTIDGNVGIGTASAQFGRVTIEESAVPLVFRETGQPADDGGLWRIPLDGGGLRWDRNTSVAGNFGTYHTPLVLDKNGDVYLVQSSGNVDIGTTGPGAKLTVQGDAVFQNSTATPFIHIDTDINSANDQVGFLLGGGTGTYGAPAGKYPLRLMESWGWNFTLQNDANSGFRVGAPDCTGYTNCNYLVVKYGGNVGIGTANPGSSSGGDSGAKLELRGTEGSATALRWFVDNTGGDGYVGWVAKVQAIADGGNFGQGRLSFTTADGSGIPVETLTLKAGNVGIGTTPGVKLSLYNSTEGTAIPVLRINTGTGGTLDSGGAIEFYKGEESSPMGRIYTVNNFSSGLGNSKGKLILSSYYNAFKDELTLWNGNVGIGETSPSAKLTVKNALDQNTIAAYSDSTTTTSSAIYAQQNSANGWAGYFSGRVGINGSMAVQNYLVSGLSDGMYFGKTKITENHWKLNNIGSDWIEKTISGGAYYNKVAMSGDGKYQTIVGGRYGVGANYIYISSNYGSTWTQKGVLAIWQGVAMSSDGKYQTAVVGGADGSARYIYISSDYGNNWAARESLRQWQGVAMSSDGKYQTAVVDGTGVSDGQVFVSSDYGNNWAAKTSGTFAWIDVTMSSDGKYQTAVVGSGFGNSFIWVSSDYGNNWAARENQRTWSEVTMSSDGKYQTAVARNNQIYISSDYGNNWAAKGNSRLWTGVAMSSDGKYQTAVAAGGSSISSDYGNTWVDGVIIASEKIAMSSDGKYLTAENSITGKVWVSYSGSAISGNVNITGNITLTPTDSPGTCSTTTNRGSIYYDASLNKPCYCNGGNWCKILDDACGSSTSCG